MGDLDLVRQRVLSIGGMRVGHTASGAPSVGKYHAGDVNVDLAGPYVEVCTADGTPGTWATVRGALPTVTSAPANNTLSLTMAFQNVPGCSVRLLAGSYLISATLNASSLTEGDSIGIQVYNSTDAVALFGVDTDASLNGIASPSLSPYPITLTGTKTIVLRAINDTAARGVVQQNDPDGHGNPCTYMTCTQYA